MKSLTLMLLLTLGVAAVARGEYRSLEELAAAFADEQCAACHKEVHRQWSDSAHSRSVIDSLGIMRDYLVTGLGSQWRKPLSREQLSRCMECHAPQLALADEEVNRQVAQLIVTAVEEKEPAKREQARAALAPLSISCIVCHNTRAVLEKNRTGNPVAGVYYGPTGRPTPAHGTQKSADLSSPLFCGQCHKTVTAADGDLVFCSSLFESYQDAYRSGGGTRSCQQCHMEAKGRGHRMPGAHDVETLRDGVELETEVRGIRVVPGKWLPAAALEIRLTNRAGHRTPDG